MPGMIKTPRDEHDVTHADIEITAITLKDCHLSGHELGGRLAQPELWKEIYMIPFSAYSTLRKEEKCPVRLDIVHGRVESIDPDLCRVHIARLERNGKDSEPLRIRDEQDVLIYDVLVICSGCRNGFWRTSALENTIQINADVNRLHEKILHSNDIGVIGAGPSGVSAAYNIKSRFPQKKVHLFYSRNEVLPGYHPKTRRKIFKRLQASCVIMHPGHRAQLQNDIICAGYTENSETAFALTEEQPCSGTVKTYKTDISFIAVGKVQPNNSFMPKNMLTSDGFVVVDQFLRCPGYSNVFSVGDVAATDPLRSSARNFAADILAHNIAVSILGVHDLKKNGKLNLRSYQPRAYRWGSILGFWDGKSFDIYTQNGWSVSVPFFLLKTIWAWVRPLVWGEMNNTVDWNLWKQSIIL